MRRISWAFEYRGDVIGRTQCTRGARNLGAKCLSLIHVLMVAGNRTRGGQSPFGDEGGLAAGLLSDDLLSLLPAVPLSDDPDAPEDALSPPPAVR